MTKATKAAAPLASIVIVDGKPVDIDVASNSLPELIDAMVEAESQSYGSHIRIAAKLNSLMAFAWFDIDHNEVSDNAKALKPYRTQLYAGFKKAGHSNPSVPGKRIRDYGRNLRAGLAPNGKAMADGSPLPEGEGEGEGEGANPAKRSPMLRNIEELTSLWKFNNKQDNLPAKVTEAQKHVAAALAALGIDVRNVK